MDAISSMDRLGVKARPASRFMTIIDDRNDGSRHPSLAPRAAQHGGETVTAGRTPVAHDQHTHLPHTGRSGTQRSPTASTITCSTQALLSVVPRLATWWSHNGGRRHHRPTEHPMILPALATRSDPDRAVEPGNTQKVNDTPTAPHNTRWTSLISKPTLAARLVTVMTPPMARPGVLHSTSASVRFGRGYTSS